MVEKVTTIEVRSRTTPFDASKLEGLREVRAEDLTREAEMPAKFDECSATGKSCEYDSVGPHAELQCVYCGKPYPGSDPLDEQIGGSHYKGKPIQPAEFSFANRYDDCIHSAIKYVSRHHADGGIEDLRKAWHFVRLRAKFIEKWGAIPRTLNITVGDYVKAQDLPDAEAGVIYLLDAIAQCHESANYSPDALMRSVHHQLRWIAQETYGESL